MPTWDELLQKIDTSQHPALLELEEYLKKLSEYRKSTVICYFSAFTLIRQDTSAIFHSICDQDIQGFMTCVKGTKKSKLDLILHTPGGDYEATKRIIYYLDKTFSHISVFVPHLALSAGTLIACASDEIWMGPYSSLGPTDPQILIEDNYIPVGAIIAEIKEAFSQVTEDPKKALLWSSRFQQIPPGLIPVLNTMQRRSNEYLMEILMRRNCKHLITEKKKLGEIVEALNSFERHTSHGKGINLEEAKKLGLNVRDITEDENLEDLVLSIYHAATIFFQQTPAEKIIANNLGKKYIVLSPIKSR